MRGDLRCFFHFIGQLSQICIEHGASESFVGNVPKYSYRISLFIPSNGSPRLSRFPGDVNSSAGPHTCADSLDVTYAAFMETGIANFSLQKAYLLCHSGVVNGDQQRIRFDIERLRMLGQYGANHGGPCAAQAGDSGQHFEFFLTQNIGYPGLESCQAGGRTLFQNGSFFPPRICTWR